MDRVHGRAGVHRSRRARRARPVWYAQVGLAGLLFAGILAAVVLADLASSWGRVHPRVSVAGVALGGSSKEAARQRLARGLEERLRQPVKVVFEDRSWTVGASRIGASVDTTDAVERAYAVGRRGGVVKIVRERARAWYSGVDLTGRVIPAGSGLADILDAVERAVDVAPRDAAVSIKGTRVQLVPATIGVHVRREALREAILRAFLTSVHSLDVMVDLEPVSLTESDVRGAYDDARMMLSGPVKVVYGEDSWDFSTEDIASWIAFREVPLGSGSATVSPHGAATSSRAAGASAARDSAPDGRMTLEAFVASDALSRTAGPRLGGLGRPPKDASFRTGGGRVTIVPSEDGVRPDMGLLAKHLVVALKERGPRRVELRTRRVAPTLTTAKARTMGIEERLATYRTTFDPGNKPRVNNIHLLAGALDGKLVEPGGTFSFNGAVGQRTAAKGYQEAPAIVNGKLVPQLGGGICQVGTTFFNTVFFSGLPVAERHNHSFYISHYPTGRDATVSWDGPDFKFRNDTSAWVLVKTGYGAGSLTISLYGTDPGYDVSFTTGSFTDIKPHRVTEVKDPTMPAGRRVIEDAGVDGRRVVVKRVVKKDGKIVREDSFLSVYKAKEEVVRVGTKPLSTPETATAVPQ